MNRELILIVSFSTRTMVHQGKLAESSLKMSRRRCSSEDTVKISKTVPLGIRNAEGFFLDLKKQVHKSRERDFRRLLNINILPLIEKAPEQQIPGCKEL